MKSNIEEHDLELELIKEKEKYLYLLADFDNYKKRTAKERSLLIKTASKSFVLGLLDIIDDFDTAIENEPIEGYELIYNKLLKMLNDKGIERFGEVGDKFDPSIHDCVCISTDGNYETITDVVQYGYLMNGELLRVAKVII